MPAVSCCVQILIVVLGIPSRFVDPASAQVLTRVKQHPQLSHIPVVMLSGLESVRLGEKISQQF